MPEYKAMINQRLLSFLPMNPVFTGRDVSRGIPFGSLWRRISDGLVKGDMVSIMPRTGTVQTDGVDTLSDSLF